MYLGQSEGGALSTPSIIRTVVSTAVKYVAQWGVTVIGYGSWAGPIGWAISAIAAIFGFIFGGSKEIKYPWYALGIALPKTSVPTVGNCLIAATKFKVISPVDADIPPDGALVMAIREGTFPEVFQKVKDNEADINSYLQRLLMPFYITIKNLTPERQISMVNTLMKPPLWNESATFFHIEGLADTYDLWTIGGGEILKNFQSSITSNFHYFMKILNDAFMRRVYRDVINSPALTKEEYGQAVGTPLHDSSPNMSEPIGAGSPTEGLLASTQGTPYTNADNPATDQPATVNPNNLGLIALITGFMVISKRR